MPLLHFLEGLCNPFDEPTSERNHADHVPRWWGIDEVKTTVATFKQDSHKWIFPLRDVLKSLQPLFEIDFYLPRAISACLKPVELREIIGENVMPVEVCCATMSYYIKDSNNSTTQNSTSTFHADGEEQTVIECAEKLMKRLQCVVCDKERSENRWLLAYLIASDAVCESRSTNKTLKVMYTAHIFLHCASVYRNICKSSDNGKQNVESIDKKHSEVQKYVINWLEHHQKEYWLSQMAEHLKVWNYAFIDRLQNEEMKKCWNSEMSKSLSKIIQKQWNMNKSVASKCIQIICKSFDTYSRPMQDCLNELALKAIESGVDVDLLSLGDAEKKKFAGLLSEMFMREWRTVKEGRDDMKEIQILTMVFTWSTFRQFMKQLYKNVKYRSCLSVECQRNLQCVVTVILSQAQAMIEGNVTVGTLRLIQTNENTFCDIIQENFTDSISSTLVRKAIRIRLKEVNAFELQVDQMKTFVDLCSHCPSVCVDEIQAVLERHSMVSKSLVSEFCKTYVIDIGADQDSFIPKVCAFDIPNSLNRILGELKMYKGSIVFDNMWSDGCNKAQKDIQTVDLLVQLLWFPIKERCNNFSKNVQAGDINFQTFANVIGDVYNDDEKGMYAELSKLGIDDECAMTRLKQLRQFRKLELCVHGARVILKFMEEYDLEGDFKSVEHIAHVSFKIQMFQFYIKILCLLF
ncbi:E3 ubiquitin-protein ligase RNF213-like [Ruditapes philippinarum]|uniref:E3 ubiquitin-protein ligase RNF213-like n=1 Tax=Ruditapes philippinarum TaxID=129788 RepID=UPI00295AB430|nr:E3 ubiquitin-protein ligase RNF213-like [Ruditapes philippinarum]